MQKSEYIFEIEKGYPAREVLVTEEMLDYTDLVGPESIDTEENIYDDRYYCYIPDELFYYGTQDEIHEYIMDNIN